MKISKYFLGLFFIIALMPLPASAQEQITITTYYPSPSGSYNELTTTGNTYLTTNSGSNVGIGTTGPADKLEVYNGNLKINSSVNGGTATPSRGFLKFDNQYDNSGNSTANKIVLYDDGSWKGGLGVSGNAVNFFSGGDFRFWTDHTSETYPGTNVVTIQDSTGYVGIGTASPTTYLNVVGPNVPAIGQISIASNSGAGQQITFYSNGSQTGHWYYSNATGLMQIGNPVTGAFIDFNSTGMINLTCNSNVGIGTASPGEKLEVNGNIRAAAFYYSSDERLKTNITRLNNALEQVALLNGSSFAWKADGRKDIGLIAQDVEKVYPELVKTDPITGLKSLEYGHLIAPLVEAVKTLKEQNQEQQAQIRQLQSELKEIKKTLGN